MVTERSRNRHTTEIYAVVLAFTFFKIKIINKTFLADFWLYSSKLGVKFERNFLNLLPGTHYIKIQFEKEPQLADFNYKFR